MGMRQKTAAIVFAVGLAHAAFAQDPRFDRVLVPVSVALVPRRLREPLDDGNVVSQRLGPASRHISDGHLALGIVDS